MKTLHFYDEPLEMHGIPFFAEKKELRRLPEEITEKIERLSFYGRRCAGARLCFRTDAGEFKVKMSLQTLTPDMGMSLYSCQTAFVMAGDRKNPYLAGMVKPKNYENLSFTQTIRKNSVMEDVTIYFPRNEIVADMELIFEDGAAVEAPTPYRNIKPILYYGSSITEGGHSTTCFNAYNAILSARLNVDYYNLGFSGSALGEPELAAYISTIDISAFVYDYDYNAPDAEYLRATHEPFFRIIRDKKPLLPVLMMSKPAVTYSPENKKRRKVIKDTYENAVRAGDKNVYFMDGESFYGSSERFRCTLDGTHPNDIGMLRMADTIEPLLAEILAGIEPENT